MRKGETIVIPKGTYYWWIRSQEELDWLREQDIKHGTTLDSAGEPRIYPGMSVGTTMSDVTAVVTRTRNVTWKHWVRRPRGLLECLMPIGNSAKIVCVREESCKHDSKRT